MSNEEEEESGSGVEAGTQGYALKEVVVALSLEVTRNLGIKGVGSIEGGSHRTRSGLSVCQVKHIPLAILLTPSFHI